MIIGMFDLETYLETRRQALEQALVAALPAPASRPAILAEAMRHAVLTGGKRLRPILCLAAAEAVGGTAQAAIWPALALELFHTYTLVHDDLPCMDNDLVRRGHPTVHAKYGETIGVLAGDALQGLAFELLGRTPELSCLQLWSPAEARQQAAAHTTQATSALTGLPGPIEPLTALVAKLLTRLL